MGTATRGEPAREAILAVVRAIAPGQVMGYGQVAAQAGLPGRARLVARVLRWAQEPGLPWHRVLRSDGRIALPQGSPAHGEQIQRLRSEGVVVECGRVRRMATGLDRDASIWG